MPFFEQSITFLLFALLSMVTKVESLRTKHYKSQGIYMNRGARCTEEIMSWFKGNYWNYDQARIDMIKGKPTPALGGHELVNVSVTFHPVYQSTLVASFRFGTKHESEHPNNFPFRFRFYAFREDASNRFDVIMTLFRPVRDTEIKLQQNNFNLIDYCPTIDEMEKLSACEVGWKSSRKLSSRYLKRHYFGTLVNGTCQLRSQRDPNVIISSKDELQLWSDQLWINDRVYDQYGKLLIGNRDNIPYKFQKI